MTTEEGLRRYGQPGSEFTLACGVTETRKHKVFTRRGVHINWYRDTIDVTTPDPPGNHRMYECGDDHVFVCVPVPASAYWNWLALKSLVRKLWRAA